MLVETYGKYRRPSTVVTPVPTSDGAGVRLLRSIGTPTLDRLDPFLLLDEFKSDDGQDYIAGFPNHPHRGFETVTYMLAGAMEHQDSVGNVGRLVGGSVQWMTAGRGIVHSEMPQQEDGLLWGFQLWVNLPAKDKMCPPRYQDIPPGDVPKVSLDNGGKIGVIAGTVDGVEGAVKGIATEPLYLDVEVPAGAELEQEVPLGHNAFCYVFKGEGEIGRAELEPGETVSASSLVVLGDGSSLSVRASSKGLRFLLVAGKPLDEPVARYGPFVMNTRDEILRAFADYQSGALQR